MRPCWNVAEIKDLLSSQSDIWTIQNIQCGGQSFLEYWGITNINTFTFHFDWTGWTMDRRVKMLLWKGKWRADVLMHSPHKCTWCWGTQGNFFFSFKQIIGNKEIYILKHHRPHKSTQMTEIKTYFLSVPPRAVHSVSNLGLAFKRDVSFNTMTLGLVIYISHSQAFKYPIWNDFILKHISDLSVTRVYNGICFYMKHFFFYKWLDDQSEPSKLGKTISWFKKKKCKKKNLCTGRRWVV